MIVIKEKVVQIFTLRIVSPIHATLIAALHLILLLDAVSHLDLKMSEVKISSKHARSSTFCAMWLLLKICSTILVSSCTSATKKLCLYLKI